MDITRRVGGESLFQAMGAILIVACVGSGLTGQAGAARLLYGMGRDDILPKRIFGHLDRKRQNPAWNIGIIGACSLVGALLVSYERSAELLNFGAFIAFMGVNLGAIRVFYHRSDARGTAAFVVDCLSPAAGFLFCLAMWWNLPFPARVGGGIWLAAGVLHLAVKSRGHVTPRTVEFRDT